MGSSLRVLFVFDEPEATLLLLQELRDGGYDPFYRHVATLQELREALALQEWDVAIAGESHSIGPADILEAIQRENKNIPLIVFTELLDERKAVDLIRQGVRDVIPKERQSGLIPVIQRELREAEQQRERCRMEKVQRAMLNLAEAALTAESLDELYRTIHAIVGELMPAGNFYISLYDESNDTLWFPYFVDEFDPPPPPQKLSRGLTAYVLRTGRPLLASPEVFDQLVRQGEVELVGAPSIDWIGVPLKSNGKTIGVLVVQSYSEGVRFSPGDQEILQFVSSQIGLAIDRKRAEQALKAESAFRKAIEDSIMAGVIATDLDGRQTYVNPAFCRMVGWSEKELVGAVPPFVYWPPEEIETISQAFRVTTGDDALPSDFELRFQRRNGERFDVYLLVSPLQDGQGKVSGWLASVYDITARKQAEEAMRRQKNRAETLARTAARLNARLNLKEILNTVCEEAARSLNVHAVALFLFDKPSNLFYLAAGVGWPEKAYQLAKPIPANISKGYFQNGGRITVIEDFRDHPNLPNARLLAELDARSAALTLLRRDSEIVGKLGVYTLGEPRSFTKDDLALLEGLGDLAGQAIVNARLFDELENSLAQLRALHTIDLAISASLDLRVTLDILLDQVVHLLGVDAAAIWLFNPTSQSLEYAVGRGFVLNQPIRSQMALDKGITGRVVVERRLIYLTDFDHYTSKDATLGKLAREGFAAYAGVPLIAKGQVKGVLEVFQRQFRDQGSHWIELLEALAGQGAIAIDNAFLFDQLQRSNEELNSAYDTTLENWIEILDRRNGEPPYHTRHLIETTLGLARKMGMKDDELIHIRRGAMLHDVGMWEISEQILTKTEPLTEEEWMLIRQHPVAAYRMLSSIPYLRPALDIPYCHHEKWDGSGYPRGLKGDQIPLSARLFAVVDVWQALTSPKPYRPAWTADRAREYLSHQAGKHFDPEIVRIFLEMI